MGVAPCKDFVHGHQVSGEYVYSGNNYRRPAPAVSRRGEIRMVIVALDYRNTSRPLTATLDGREIEHLAQVCGVRDATILYNRHATRQNVVDVIQRTGERCSPDDYFVFFFAGHGTSVRDVDGDEDDGLDEALVLQDEEGRKDLLVDDDFARIIRKALHRKVRVVILCDCCHSGTIGDFSRQELWEGMQAVSLAGCRDSQESGDTGKGGIFTHSVLFAIERLQEKGFMEYSVGRLFNKAMKEDARIFNSKQQLTFDSTLSVEADEMAWPLLPLSRYKAPLSRTRTALRYGNSGW